MESKAGERPQPRIRHHDRWRRAAPLWLAIAGIAALACGASRSQPRITSVSPAHLRAGSTAELLVSGSGFGDGARVSLGTIALPRVRAFGDGLLSADLPADIAAGAYDVTVSRKDGQTAVIRTAVRLDAPPVEEGASSAAVTPPPALSPARPAPAAPAKTPKPHGEPHGRH